jgi:CBS domain-containing protein
MTKTKEIMTTDVATIRGSDTVAEAEKLMKFKALHSLIVERRGDDDAYGIITDKDIADKVIAYGKDPNQVRVYEVMTKPCITVNPDLATEYVARLFAQTGIDRAPVIQGELLGIISITDILQKSDFLGNPRVPFLEKVLQGAIANARAVSAAEGANAAATAKAWAVVDEIEAEVAFCKGKAPKQRASECFGDPVPEAAPAVAVV